MWALNVISKQLSGRDDVKKLEVHVKLVGRRFTGPRMRLVVLFVFLLRLPAIGQVIFAAGGKAQSINDAPPVPLRPDIVLAVPGEYSGGTPFQGRMRTRGFAYDALQTKPALRADPVTFSSSYSWRIGITTTVFWVGEPASLHSPDNVHSAWDREWMANYGGVDTPVPSSRESFRPIAFVPRENPFYVALPYNDQCPGGIRPEASKVIPWFDPGVAARKKSNLKGRWLAIRKATRICYAQWEDVGPFQIDHWAYVFGKERPRPNRNQDSGLDVSPAVRDYLGLDAVDVTDWRFVEQGEIPDGPWKLYGQDECPGLDVRMPTRLVLAAATNVPVTKKR
jgi:hypothetical protein